jgi:3',5'-cyclic AMP phosphodiesterase CpdA
LKYHPGQVDHLTRAATPPGTLSGGQFDWGGRLLKCNGGAQRSPQADWKPAVECKGIRGLDCKTDGSSRCESRP